jgi:hypothetical protein
LSLQSLANPKSRLKSKGKSSTDTVYSGWLILVDNASTYVHAQLCVKLLLVRLSGQDLCLNKQC